MKRRLALRSPYLLLACKAVIVGIGAGSAFGDSLFLKAIFFLFSALFFFFPTIQTLPYFWSWLFLLNLVFWNGSLGLSNIFTPFSFGVFFAILSFVHLGSKDLIFIRHKELHVILCLFLVFLSLLFLMNITSPAFFLEKIFLVFLSSFFLIREFLYGYIKNSRSRIVALVLSLLLSELSLFISWLPLSPLRSALLIFTPLLFFLYLLMKSERGGNSLKTISLSADFFFFFLVITGILLSSYIFQ